MRPILFSGAMVRAILSGRKTQTRRTVGLATLGPSTTPGYDWTFRGIGGARTIAGHQRHPYGCWQDLRTPDFLKLCPFGAPGDRLWVRETWASDVPGCDRGLSYRADHRDGRGDGPAHPMRWRPSIHMPRDASRLTLAVTSVRVERLQAITDADVKAEGVTGWSKDGAIYKYAPADDEGDGPCWSWTDCPLTPREGFAKLWDECSPEGPRWADDPWVWVVGFRRAEVTP